MATPTARAGALVLIVLIAATAAQPAAAGRPISAVRDWILDTLGLGGWKPPAHCHDPKYRDVTLKLVKEMPIGGLFPNLKGQTKFEGSGMAEYKGRYIIVFDSLMALGYVDDRFQFRDPNNVLVGEPGPESQFEGVTVMENGHVILLQETMPHGPHEKLFHPETMEVTIDEDLGGYTVLRRCLVKYGLPSENKGFEGVSYHWDGKDGRYLLGLCEGNYCEGGAKGREPGNGRIIALYLNETAPSEHRNSSSHHHDCSWQPFKTIELPDSVRFTDYSEIAVRGDRVAITSQETSALWLGTMDWEKLQFVDDGVVYHFPRDNLCNRVYCNIEGIEFIDDERFIVTSDKAKAYQPHVCVAKDQMVHVFMAPKPYKKP